MNSNNRIAATLYSLGTVCLRNISINTQHKGDDNDDDDDDIITAAQFLGSFAKLRNAAISFVVPVRPSVRLHAATRLQVDTFS